MSDCCFAKVCNLLCEVSFEPIFVCDDEKPISCSDRLLQIFEYSNREEFLSKSMREIINTHFNPASVRKNGSTYPAGIKDLTFAIAKNADSVKTSASTKVKSWNIKGRTFYTVAIRDIPIIAVANSPYIKRDKAIEDTSSTSPFSFDRAIIDVEQEPEVQKRLLNQFSQMADALPSLVWIIAKTGEIIYENSRVFETFGIKSINQSWQDCIHPEDITGFIPFWYDGVLSGSYTKFEVRYRNVNEKPDANGNYNYRWHFIQSTPIFNVDGSIRHFVCNAVDVQALKEAESEKQVLIASEKLATEASKLKSAFLSMMSHEIRTPLFGIVGNTCLLMDTQINETQKEYVNNIEGSAKLMMAVIQDILDFSRIEAGKLRVISEPFSFNRVIDACTGMVRTAAKKKGLKFNIVTPENEVKAMGDSTRILQVLTNLASNAIKFTSEGSVSINFEHKVNESKDVCIKISVTDTGIGMSKELQDKLFTPWVQGDSSNRRLYGGSGLGLAISKALLDMMGGEVGISSELGKGSCFWFQLTLPSVDSDFDLEGFCPTSSSPMGDAKFEFYNFNGIQVGNKPNQTQKEESFPDIASKINEPKKTNTKIKPKSLSKSLKKNSTESKKVSAKYRVLLAEDNPINQIILKRFLEKMGLVEYFLASDGQMALDEFKQKPLRHYDIILLDQSMPKMDGDMVCRCIRQLDPDQVVISVSANALLSDRNYFSEIGMNDHIPKPVDYNTFSNVLKHWFEKLPGIYSSKRPPLISAPRLNTSFMAVPV